MPDLPIDTLFIVGLLLASFIGKLMEGKAKRRKEAPAKRPEKNNENDWEPSDKKELGDILKEAFGEVIQQPLTPKVPKVESPVGYDDIDKKANNAKKAETEKKPVKTNLYKSTGHTSSISTKNTRDWLKNEALGSPKSLRRAFLVKEVLNQPPGLR